MEKYINKLNDGQYFELARAIDPTTASIRVSNKGDEGVDIYLAAIFVDDDGNECEIEDFYIFHDYGVEAYDAPGPDWEALAAYRTKMLEWFGSDYACSYLLSE